MERIIKFSFLLFLVLSGLFFGVHTAIADTLIGYRWNGAQEEIISFDPTTGSTSIIATLDLDWVTSDAFAVDSDNHKAYLYGTKDGELFWRIYTTNLITGEVSSVPFLESGTGGFGFDVYVTTPKLFLVIPGVGFGTTPEHGEKMLERAKVMFRYDDECLVEIPETSYLSDEEIRDMVIEATRKAKEKGKDVIVNIDMDLDGFNLWEYIFWSGRWTASVTWAGGIANIVSEAFSEENPSGFRMLYAHSAGVDAASQSVQQMQGKMMYDDLNLFNGRTDAGTLWEALEASHYGWWQVKVFTSKGDYPAIPLKTLSNYDAARQGAGKAWVHAHSLTFTGHNGLIENIGVAGGFKVNLGPYGSCDVVKTVEEMMLWDWLAGCPGSIALERMR